MKEMEMWDQRLCNQHNVSWTITFQYHEQPLWKKAAKWQTSTVIQTGGKIVHAFWPHEGHLDAEFQPPILFGQSKRSIMMNDFPHWRIIYITPIPLVP